jgi:hypothetical protein
MGLVLADERNVPVVLKFAGIPQAIALDLCLWFPTTTYDLYTHPAFWSQAEHSLRAILNSRTLMNEDYLTDELVRAATLL